MAASAASGTRRRWRDMLPLGRRRRLPPLYYDRGYTLALQSSPLDPLRAEKVLAALELMGLLRGAEPVTAPPRATLRALLRVHDREYLETLAEAAPYERAFGLALSEVQRERALEVQRAMTGGTLAAARHALAERGIAFNLGGGLHHAHRDHGGGFCLFNDVAVAVAVLRRRGFGGRVLVVDLDLHDGDGTRALFATDPTVYTYSLHNRNWDEPAAVASTAIELGSGVGDDTFLAKLRDTLPPVLASQQPDLVFYLAGCDPAADDALGDWQLTAAGMLARDRYVAELVRGPGARGGPALVVLLAGGYGERSWRYTARFLAWLASDGRRAVEPPSDDEVLLARYRAIARLLSPGELSGESGDGGWGLSEEDILGSLPAVGRGSRFLDYYTAHGIELVLESSGVFDRLRDLGFEQPTLELDLAGSHGDTLRVWGEPRRHHLLVELRARRDRRTLPGFELLAVEWLLLQNPRATFTRHRPPLPGQRYPGLGMLADAVALLVQVCHRLHLDGLTFTPSHYHLASQSTKYVHFVDPRDDATFDALREALAGVPLAAATSRVEAGAVVDARSGDVVRWQPRPMVLVVSEPLRRWFEEQRYDARRAEARAGMRFLLT